MTGDKSIRAAVGASENDTICCPFCDYENPRPHLQIMNTVRNLLCRGCQRPFPLTEEDR